MSSVGISATQHAMPREFDGKWEMKGPNFRYAEYSVKLV